MDRPINHSINRIESNWIEQASDQSVSQLTNACFPVNVHLICNVLCCVVLCCVVLFCVVLCCVVLCCVVLCCVVLCCVVLVSFFLSPFLPSFLSSFLPFFLSFLLYSSFLLPPSSFFYLFSFSFFCSSLLYFIPSFSLLSLRNSSYNIHFSHFAITNIPTNSPSILEITPSSFTT